MSNAPDEGEEKGVEVQVYRSGKRADTYLYLPIADAYEDLPEALQQHFGEATAFLSFWLHEERYLAQADPPPGAGGHPPAGFLSAVTTAERPGATRRRR